MYHFAYYRFQLIEIHINHMHVVIVLLNMFLSIRVTSVLPQYDGCDVQQVGPTFESRTSHTSATPPVGRKKKQLYRNNFEIAR